MKRMNAYFSGFRGAALLLGLLAASCIPTRKEADQVGSGTELGNVVGAIYTAENRPAAGVTVTLYPEETGSAGILTAVTDADGKYAFQGAVGAYSLFVLDGAGNGLMVDSIDADTASPIDLERMLLSPLASVSGYAKVTGVREAGSKVEMQLSRSPFRNEADPNAGFLWTGLPAGEYWFSISYSWAKPISLPVTLASGETLDLDTLTLANEYSVGISRRDTLKVSTSQLPLTLGDKLATDIGTVDSVFWVLNGGKITANRTDRYLSVTLESDDLHDTGFNLLEMRLYLADTTISRAWYVDLDDSPVAPWARHAVKGVFLGSEANPRQNTGFPKLGTFQILERRPLSQAEMAFWNWSPVPGGDTALPGLVKIPMLHSDLGNRCGDADFGADPELFPGDTVTFMTSPDAFSGGVANRIRKDEDYSDFGNLAWYPGASWSLADLHHGKVKGSFRDIRIDAGALKIRLDRNYIGSGATSDCLPLSRSFALGADGIPGEYVAMPAGMSSGNLLLHFRAGLPKGLFADSLAASGDYVFLDSAGHGVAGSGSDRREVQLSASEVAELKALLAALPAVLPLEWNQDYLEDLSAPPMNMDYLLSGGRGSVLAGAPRSRPAPQAKVDLFQAVEAWLLAHDLL